MKVKIDTKEKFHVITLSDVNSADIIAADLITTATNFLQHEIRNVILNMSLVETIDETLANEIVILQQKFYESNASFVVCEMNKIVEEKFDELNLLEVMNTTPSESEAWDIVQMEEIERELLDDGDVEFAERD